MNIEKEKIVASQRYVKVFKGAEFDVTRPFLKEWDENSEPNTIVYRLFAGKDISFPEGRDYTEAIYRPLEGNVQITIPFEQGFNQDKARDLFFELNSNLVMTNQSDTGVVAHIKVPNFKFRDDIMLEFMMNNPIVSRYIYAHETSLLVVTNRRPTYNLLSAGENNLSFRIEQREAKINEGVDLGVQGSLLMSEKEEYAYITIDADRSQDIEVFLTLLVWESVIMLPSGE